MDYLSRLRIQSADFFVQGTESFGMPHTGLSGSCAGRTPRGMVHDDDGPVI